MIASVRAASLVFSLSCLVDASFYSAEVVHRQLPAGGTRPVVPPKTFVVDGSPVTLPEVDNRGFWFANFTVGNARNLELLIDTGSSDVYMNPGVYKPSKRSKNLHKRFKITFATTNPNGSGTSTLSGPLYRDIVASHGLSVGNQELGVQQRPKKGAFPHEGLVGFASSQTSAFGGRPWMHSLCAEKKVDKCRFGLAFKTNGRGSQTIGGVDHSKFSGPLTTAPIHLEWNLLGDIAVNNKVIQKNTRIYTDSGTTVVYGPVDDVRRIFKRLGVQTVYTPGRTSYLHGYFPCDKPPTFGFSFPSTADAAAASSPISKKSRVFNIDGKAMAFKNNGNNNCTAALQGMSSPSLGSLWLVGQAFFQGLYIDHNIDDMTMGFAPLVGSGHGVADSSGTKENSA